MSKASDLARLMTSGSTAVHGEAGVTASGSTGATTVLQQGLAKSWCVFNGEGTVAITDSNNSTSLTDVGVGDYTLGFTNNMNSAAYIVSGSSVGSDAANYYNFMCGDGANNTSSVYEINFKHSSDTVNQIDNDHSSTIVHGDLA